jgi:hypothetical protein
VRDEAGYQGKEKKPVGLEIFRTSLELREMLSEILYTSILSLINIEFYFLMI